MGEPSAFVPGWQLRQPIWVIGMFVSASNPPFAAEYHVALPLRVACKLVGNASSGGIEGLTTGRGLPAPLQAERTISAPKEIAQDTALITLSQRIIITSV